jgi:hypothetical protein
MFQTLRYACKWQTDESYSRGIVSFMSHDFQELVAKNASVTRKKLGG